MGKIKKALSSVGKIAGCSFLAFGVYTLSLSGLHVGVANCSQKIKSQSHLEEVMKVEMKNLGIENKKIKAVYDHDFGNVTYVKKYDMNNDWDKHESEGYNYALVLSSQSQPWPLFTNALNVGMLRKNLYHIYAGHCDANLGKEVGHTMIEEDEKWYNLDNISKHFFYYHPKALIYAATGLKI